MNPDLLALFTTPLELPGLQRLALMVPLCLSISVVYKTIRCEKLQDVPMSSMLLWVTMLAGMYAVGIGIWLVNLLLA